MSGGPNNRPDSPGRPNPLTGPWAIKDLTKVSFPVEWARGRTQPRAISAIKSFTANTSASAGPPAQDPACAVANRRLDWESVWATSQSAPALC